jgi:hypothetical protein
MWLHLQTGHSRNSAAPSLLGLIVLTACLGWAGAASSGWRNDANTSSPLNTKPLSGAYFAVADFDGDLKPDVVTVGVQRVMSPRNFRYAIRFELTARGTQSFGVTAPAGGLQIVALDVNGDHFLDLLVTSAWQHREVAVLLNDGQGNFTLAEPSDFAASFRACGTGSDLAAPQACDSAVLVRSESPAGALLALAALNCPPPITGRLLPAAGFGWNQLLLSPRWTRAPPGVVPPATFF